MSERFDRLARSIQRDLDIEYGVTYGEPFKFESPIERALYWALLYTSAYVTRPTVTKESFVIHGYERLSFEFKPQQWVLAQGRKYRVDFLVHAGKRPVTVECDGHDFHERTHQQARRDRQRDRDLQSIGMSVLRFTGSEIYAAPKSVAIELMEILEAIAAREGR